MKIRLKIFQFNKRWRLSAATLRHVRVVAGSTVGTGVLAALGRFTYIKYCQNGGAPLIANLETSLLDGSMEV